MRTGAFLKRALRAAALPLLVFGLLGAAGPENPRIEALSVETQGSNTVVTLTATGDVGFRDFRLENPPRVVVDCLGAVHALEQGTRTVGDGNVKKIRSSQYVTTPTNVTRVVIDLAGNPGYTTSRDGDRLRVTVGSDIAEGRVARAPTEEYVKTVRDLDGDPDATPASAPAATAAEPVYAELTEAEAVVEETGTSDQAETPSETGMAGSTDTDVEDETVSDWAQMEDVSGSSDWTQMEDESEMPDGAETPSETGMNDTPETPAETETADWAATTDEAESVPMWPAEKETEATPTSWQESGATPTGDRATGADTVEDAPRGGSSPAWAAPVRQDASAGSTTSMAADEAQKAWSVPSPRGSTSWPPPSPAASSASTKTIRALDVQGADIKTVLRNLSEFAGVNIIAAPEVEGEVYLHLRNVPWEEALETILRAHGFDYREEFGILRVGKAESLRKEELDAQAAERRKDDLLPLVTRIVPVRYANAEEMSDALEELTTQRGKVEVDQRSNSIIITDITLKIDEIARMVASLDNKPKQVEIVSKLVDVDVAATRALGIRWQAANLASSTLELTGDAEVDAGLAEPVGTLRVGHVESWGNLMATLETLASKNKADIISNPRITTLDNRKANIMVGQEIPLIVSDEAGNPITELVQIGIIMETTPHVNADNSITLDLHPEVSELSAEATVQGGVIISTSQADTRVIVENGQTAVIGGLIKSSKTKFEVGVPILMDIPLLGNLFKSTTTGKRDRELIIFVTPTVVELGDAAPPMEG
jgi:type IV pilus secretin PilQ/predicted competence protein